VASLAIDADALASCGVAPVALVPVQLLDVRLLLLVSFLCGCVRRLTLRIVCILLLLRLVDLWSEHAILDGEASTR